MLNLRQRILSLLAGLLLSGTLPAAVVKCRTANGDWAYAATRPAGCISRPVVVSTTPPVWAHASRRRQPPPAARIPAARMAAGSRRRLARWQAVRRELEMTPIPRARCLVRWRSTALRLVAARVAAAKHAVAAVR